MRKPTSYRWTVDLTDSSCRRRRAATIVLVAITLPVLIGFAALTIDVGTMFSVRAELQASADAAALAATAAYVSDPMLQVRLGYGGSSEFSQMMNIGHSDVDRVSALNHTFGADRTAISHGDVQFGWIDTRSATSPLITGIAADAYNAVEVTVRRTSDTNGAVTFFLAPIFGKSGTDVTATAVAVLDDRFAGYDVEDGTAALWPISLRESIYNHELTNGSDDWGMDWAGGSPQSGGDGVREINLYPHVNAPGNFGLLNVGINSNSASAVGNQFENGVTAEQLDDAIGSSTISVYDSDGGSITHDIGGTPGLKSTLEKSMEDRVGETISYLLHDQVTGNGDNTQYRITKIVFARLMNVNLQGSEDSRGVWVQPIAYAGAGVRVSSNAPSSGGTVGQIMLAR